MKNILKIHCENTNKEYPFEGGDTLETILIKLKKELDFEPICALVNNKLEGLHFPLYTSKKVKFLSIYSAAGRRVYIRSLCMLMFKGLREINRSYTIRIEHSISNGYFCRIFNENDPVLITQDFIDELKHKMLHDIIHNFQFSPKEIRKEDAIEVFKSELLFAKVKLFNTRHDLYVQVYDLDDVTDSYYGPLLPSTGYIKTFDIVLYENGFLLLGPEHKDFSKVQQPVIQKKMFQAFTEHLDFNKIIGVRNIGELNEAIMAGHSSELINVAEALHAKKISAIASEITKRYHEGGARIILVAGPSSSGKTTTAQRLGIYLLTNLLRPVTISLDNYFVNREDTPLDESGEKDFEHIDALDLQLFNKHLSQLLRGEEIEMPYYNFEKGRREYHGQKISLGNNGLLLIEGIHGLNPMLTSEIDIKQKFKLYVSALTTLSIDDHNWIPTTDNRLLRRIIRDYKYRGTSAIETIRRWPSVRRGEEKWIFPYQENADAMFNSSLLFELAVMKEYGETILKQVRADCEEYAEAYRLRKFLGYFESITEDLIPPTSLLREFVGGSSLKY